MDDTISRAAVVDAIEGVDWYHQNQHGEMVHGANSDEHQAWYKAEDIYKAIESVPSAQPTDRNGQERTGTDLISRQAAIDAMMKLQAEDIEAYGASIPEGFDGDRAVTALKALPSAQQWIPCDRELPKPNEEDGNGFYKAYLVQDGRWMDVARWDGKYWIAWGYSTVLLNVVAWMPLPEPWKGEQDG